MAELSVVKKLSYLREEQKHAREFLEVGGLSLLRGGIAEFFGEQTAGKTSMALTLMSGLTQGGEVCAVVDLNNAFDPVSAKAAGVVLENLLWIRCGGKVESALTAVDYVLQAKGFGLAWLNIGNVPHKELNIIPSSYWYRFRAKIRGSQTILVVTASRSLVSSAADQSFYFDPYRTVWKGSGRFKLLDQLQINLNTRKPFLVKPDFKVMAAEYCNE
jgi:hypothetical protein